MQIPSKYLEKAVEQIASMPGIGKRTALRLALHLHGRTDEEIQSFVQSIHSLKTLTHNCEACGNISDAPLCFICIDEQRNKQIICVVEDIRDIMAIEGTHSFKGIYHVLGGVISPMDGIGPQDLRINSLVEKCTSPDLEEVIFALSPTMEGDTTNYYLFKRIQRENLLITSLSRGVAMGTEIQYADEQTLGKSLEQRMEFKLTF